MSMRKTFVALLLAASVTPAFAQDKTFELKLSHWVPASHPLQKALEDWGAAVEAARRQGAGLGPFRGLRRLEVRVFGADVAPPTEVYEAGLRYQLNRFARAVDSLRIRSRVGVWLHLTLPSSAKIRRASVGAL